MKIEICYNSIWNNSFLSDDKKKYIASSQNLDSKLNIENSVYYKERKISLTTAYGVLFRILGAQAPLEHLLENEFNGCPIKPLIKEGKVSYRVIESNIFEEIVFLRNLNKHKSRNELSGVPDNSFLSLNKNINERVLFVLSYNRKELIDYILNDVFVLKENPKINNIVDLCSKINELSSLKSLKINDSELLKSISEKYNTFFENKNCNLLDKSSLVLVALNIASVRYCSEYTDTKFFTTNNTISGVSLSCVSFTPKSLISRFAEHKIIYGNPYMFYDKTGKKRSLIKSDGILEIIIDADKETSLLIENMINEACVSSFYVGKKGLGYIRKIYI